MKRTGWIRRKPRRDPVTPELHAQVLARDGMCILAKLQPSHECRDQWGTPHDPRRLELLTLEHVQESLRMGRRAPSDMSHLTAMCWSGNVGVPSKEQRAAIRQYLVEVSA